MKLFIVDYVDDCEREYKIVIANNEEDALLKLTEEDYNCLMFATAYEISDIDGYKITLEKV